MIFLGSESRHAHGYQRTLKVQEIQLEPRNQDQVMLKNQIFIFCLCQDKKNSIAARGSRPGNPGGESCTKHTIQLLKLQCIVAQRSTHIFSFFAELLKEQERFTTMLILVSQNKIHRLHATYHTPKTNYQPLLIIHVNFS